MISSEDIKTYETDGVVCLRGVFGGDCIEALRAATEVAMANPGPNAESYGEAYCGDMFPTVWSR